MESSTTTNGRAGWSAMTDEPGPVDRRVAEAVRAVPEGYVTTYGAIARQLGLRSARQVGAVLAKGQEPMPWHRVLPATGRLVEGLAAEQERRLRDEGVDVRGGRVDLARYRWR
jgi:methylated-DNA-protein-cysteine methyltransferase related protein